MIGIINSGLGNVGSVRAMLEHLGVSARIVTTPAEIELSAKLVMPGVGAFDSGMAKLREGGLESVLNDAVLTRRKPILGICLGMQLFSRGSEEGSGSGLGWLPARARRFQTDLRIPHMGWNTVIPEPESIMFSGIVDPLRFYFAHSFHLEAEDASIVHGRTDYGYRFHSAVKHGHIWGVQFHPEKSHKYGMALLKNFVEHA